MKVKAKEWVMSRGEWHMAGSVFEVDEADLPALSGAVEPVEDSRPVSAGDEQPKAKRAAKAKK